MWTIQVVNRTTGELQAGVEPLGMFYPLPVGAALGLRSAGQPGNGVVEIVRWAGGIEAWLMSDVQVRLPDGTADHLPSCLGTPIPPWAPTLWFTNHLPQPVRLRVAGLPPTDVGPRADRRFGWVSGGRPLVLTVEDRGLAVGP